VGVLILCLASLVGISNSRGPPICGPFFGSGLDMRRNETIRSLPRSSIIRSQLICGDTRLARFLPSSFFVCKHQNPIPKRQKKGFQLGSPTCITTENHLLTSPSIPNNPKNPKNPKCLTAPNYPPPARSPSTAPYARNTVPSIPPAAASRYRPPQSSQPSVLSPQSSQSLRFSVRSVPFDLLCTVLYTLMLRFCILPAWAGYANETMWVDA